jgi:hypothetical protein
MQGAPLGRSARDAYNSGCDIDRLRHGYGWRGNNHREADQRKPPSAASGLAIDLIVKAL